jgi:nucleoside-diphosphate-sugar epimerase
MTRRILVTGASGFIGRPLLAALEAEPEPVTIHAVQSLSSPPAHTRKNVIWHRADLLDKDAPHALVAELRPDVIIHAAWTTAHGTFWTDPANQKWLSASLRLMDAALHFGCHRFVNLGSVAEYHRDGGRMIEGVAAETPVTPYGQAKLAFTKALNKPAVQRRMMTATGRVFHLYGPREKPERLIPSICRALIHKQKGSFGSDALWRDYLHVSDLARAIVALTASELTGPVNLASGEPVRLSQIFNRLEERAGLPSFLARGSRVTPVSEPIFLFADTLKMSSTGWRPAITLEDGLAMTYTWWQRELARTEPASRSAAQGLRNGLLKQAAR